MGPFAELLNPFERLSFRAGLNYRSHALETKKELPRFPVFAFKNPASVIGPDDTIVIPKVAREKPEVDFEAELAIAPLRSSRNRSLEP